MVVLKTVIYNILALYRMSRGPKDHKEDKNSMNKYELALIVSAKIEDDARAAVVEKAKEVYTRLAVQ